MRDDTGNKALLDWWDSLTFVTFSQFLVQNIITFCRIIQKLTFWPTYEREE